MGVVVALLVEAADSQSPAAVLVPAYGLHVAGLHRDDRRAHLAHHVVAQVLALKAVASGHAEVVEVAVGETLGNGENAFRPYFVTQIVSGSPGAPPVTPEGR